ncbi:MAG TPA: hypothetical protein V6D03_04110 [Candidatus Caenarcaniphilales bacterium]
MDELRTALELATEEELKDLTDILFRRRFNPLDYIHAPEPVVIHNQARQTWLDTLEQRFRFLAADGITVLKGKTSQVTYRQVLLRVCHYLKLPYTASLSTTDLEAEIFLNLLKRAWKQLPSPEKEHLAHRVHRSVKQLAVSQPVWLELQQDPLRLLLEGGGILAVSSFLRPVLLQLVARQFATHFAAYQVARQAACTGGTAVLQLQGQAALQAAGRGMALSTARYGAVKSIFAFLGPVLWIGFFADLGWRAIATNYGRVIPTVFALAQIRLTRSDYLCLT